MRRHFLTVMGLGIIVSLVVPFMNMSFSAETNSELEAIRQAAQAEAAAKDEEDKKDKTFTSGALSLQSLNPEISVTGDFLWTYKDVAHESATSEFIFRNLGIHAESYLDPYTRFKAALEFHEDDVELGEAYMTRFGLIPNLNATIGKFRQQLGVVNRWHKHGLDQVDFPLALRSIFGEGGLNQAGLSIDYVAPPLIGLSNELTLQLTDGQNGRVFAENTKKRSSGLAHYKLYRDLTNSTYGEIGFSGLVGQNNAWDVSGNIVEKSLDAYVLGADLTFLWEPTDRMRYRDLTWRSEAYLLNKELLAPDGSGEDDIDAWGAYSYIQSKVSRTLFVGVRGDYFKPDTKTYADSLSTANSPLAVTHPDPYQWQVSPYVTWFQSPFVHYRAEFNHKDGSGTGPRENQLWLQCIFAAGPHKHERY
jgi:hypothetical protein